MRKTYHLIRFWFAVMVTAFALFHFVPPAWSQAQVLLSDLNQIDPAKVEISYSRVIANRQTGNIELTATIKNKSTETFSLPLFMLLQNIIPANVHAVNQDTNTSEGIAAYTFDSAIAPNAVFTKKLIFTNPGRDRFDFAAGLFVFKPVQTFCNPGQTRSCYSGPSGTSGIGICKAGTEQCLADGTAFGPCGGETLPGTEVCNDGLDQDCNGSDCVTQGLTLSITNPANGVVVPTSPIVVEGKVSDATAIVRVGNSYARVTAPNFSAPAVFLNEGANELNVSAAARNGESLDLTRTIILDSTKPVVEILSPPPRAFVPSETVKVIGKVTDSTTVTCKLGNIPLVITEQAPGLFNFSGELAIPEGESKVDVKCIDQAGNEGSDAKTVFFGSTIFSVTGIKPSSGATDIPTSAIVEISLSAAVDPKTVNAEAVFLSIAGRLVSAAYSVSQDGRKITLQPSAALPESAVVNVSITTGVTDLSGKPLSRTFGSFFETAASEQGTSRQGIPIGEVFDDSRGQPLEAATIKVTKAGQQVSELQTDSKGRYLLDQTTEPLVLLISKSGFTGVDRKVELSNEFLIDLLDARLTPLASAVSVDGALGGRVENGEKDVLTIPAGAFNSDATIRLTGVSEQGPQTPFPLGWAPIAIVDLQSSKPFNPKATLEIKDRSGDSTGKQVVVAIYDSVQHAWKKLSAATVGTTGLVTVSGISDSGQFALLLADTGAGAPVIPADGSILTSSLAQSFPDDSTATGAVTPSSGRVDEPTGAIADIKVTSASAMRSGTLLSGNFLERINLITGGTYSPGDNDQDVILYRRPVDATGKTLGAKFAVSASRTFTLSESTGGAVTINLGERAAPARTVVSPTVGGGVVSTDGSRLIVAPGSFDSSVPVSLTRIDSEDISFSPPSGQQLLGAIDIDLSGKVSKLPLGLVLASPDGEVKPGSTIVLVKLGSVFGVERQILVGVGRPLGIDSSAGLAVETEFDGKTFAGIRDGGRYLFISVDESLRALGTTVQDEAGNKDGHLLEIDTLPFVTTSALDGTFSLLSIAGDFSLTATGSRVRDSIVVSGKTSVALQPIVIPAVPPKVERVTVKMPNVLGDLAGPVVLSGNPVPEVDDDNQDGTHGDGDGRIESGERVGLTIYVRNEGKKTAPIGRMFLDIITSAGRITPSPTNFPVDPITADKPLKVGPFVFDVPSNVGPAAIQYNLLYELDGGVVGLGTMRGNEIPFKLPLGVEHPNVPLASEITVAFSEPLDLIKVRQGTSLFNETAGKDVDVIVVTSGEPNQFHIRPSTLLEQGSIFRLTLSSAVTDGDGRPILNSPYIVRFSSRDKAAPTPIESGKIDTTIDGNNAVIKGGGGSVNFTDVVVIVNNTTGYTALANVNSDGSFSGEVPFTIGDNISILVRDLSDNQTVIPVGALLRKDPSTGKVIAAIIGKKGGTFARDGFELTVPPDGVLVPAEFSIERVEAPFELPQELTDRPGLAAAFAENFDVVSRFNLKVEPAILNQAIDISFAAPAGTQVGELFLLVRTVDVTIGGIFVDLQKHIGHAAVTDPIRGAKRLEIIETATAKNIGSSLVISTDSPPFKGLIDSGIYTLLSPRDPLAFLHGRVIDSELGQPILGAVVRADESNLRTAAFVTTANHKGEFVVPDGMLTGLEGSSTVSSAITASNLGAELTFASPVSGAKNDKGPPSVNLWDVGDLPLADTVPAEFIAIIGDIQPPKVSISFSGESLQGSIAASGKPITVTVLATDNDKVESLALFFDQGSGYKPVPLDDDGTATLATASDALFRFRAEARDPKGNRGIALDTIRVTMPGANGPSVSLVGVKPVALIPSKSADLKSIPEEDKISSDKPISTQLSEPLDPDSVTDETVTLRDPEGNLVSATVQLSDDNTRLTVLPDRELRLGACYKLELSNQVKDANGDAYDGAPLYVVPPAPVQVTTVLEPNSRDLAAYGSNLIAGSYPFGESFTDGGKIRIYNFHDEEGRLLIEPTIVSSIPANGQPLSIAVDGTNVYVANKFLGPYAMMQAVLNPLSFIPGLGAGLGAASGIQGAGANLVQCYLNPLACFGAEFIWVAFPIPPSNIQVIDLAVIDKPVNAGVEALNRFVIPGSENVPLAQDTLTLNIPGLWGPNTWPIKTTVNSDGVWLVNSHMNLERYSKNIGDDLKITGRIDDVMGVGQFIGRCEGGKFNDQFCKVSGITLPSDGSIQCGSFSEPGICRVKDSFKEATFLDDVIVSTEDGVLRFSEPPPEGQVKPTNRTLTTRQLPGIGSATTLANSTGFVWRNKDGDLEISNLLFVKDNNSVFTIYDITDPKVPVKLSELPNISGAMNVDSCRGVVYLHSGPAFHVIDFNDPTQPRDLNSPGGTNKPFSTELIHTFNLSRIESLDGTVFAGGPEGFTAIATKRCSTISTNCNAAKFPSSPPGTFDTGCSVEAVGLTSGLPIRQACLRFSIGPSEPVAIRADEPSISLSATVMIPDPERPGLDIFVLDGSKVKWEIIEGSGAAVLPQLAPTISGSSSTSLRTSQQAGAKYKVRAVLQSIRFHSKFQKKDIEVPVFGAALNTKEIIVLPGRASSIEITRDKPDYRADETDNITLTAKIKDSVGNTVLDGTSVFWQLENSATLGGGIITELTDIVTKDGFAKVVVRSQASPGVQTLKLNVDGLEHEEQIHNSALAIQLTADKSAINLEQAEPINLTANITGVSGGPVADGTEVDWNATNGEIIGDPVTIGGKATAKLYTLNGRYGEAFVRVAATHTSKALELQFTTDNELKVAVPIPLVVGDRDKDGTIDVERADGSIRSVAYKTGALLDITGPPGALLSIKSSESGPISMFSFESQNGGKVPDIIGNNQLSLNGATLDSVTPAVAGLSSLKLVAGAQAIIEASQDLRVNQGLGVHFYLRAPPTTAGTIFELKDAFTIAIDGERHLILQTKDNSKVTTKKLANDVWYELTVKITSKIATLSINSADLDETISSTLEGSPIVNSGEAVIGGTISGNIDELTCSSTQTGTTLLALYELSPAGERRPIPSGQTRIDDNGKAKLLAQSLGSFDEQKHGPLGTTVNFSIRATVEGRDPGIPQPKTKEVNLTVARAQAVGDLFEALDKAETYGEIANGAVFGVCEAGENWCAFGRISSGFFPPTMGYSSVREALIFIPRIFGQRVGADGPVRWWEVPFQALNMFGVLRMIPTQKFAAVIASLRASSNEAKAAFTSQWTRAIGRGELNKLETVLEEQDDLVRTVADIAPNEPFPSPGAKPLPEIFAAPRVSEDLINLRREIRAGAASGSAEAKDLSLFTAKLIQSLGQLSVTEARAVSILSKTVRRALNNTSGKNFSSVLKNLDDSGVQHVVKICRNLGGTKPSLNVQAFSIKNIERIEKHAADYLERLLHANARNVNAEANNLGLFNHLKLDPQRDILAEIAELGEHTDVWDTVENLATANAEKNVSGFLNELSMGLKIARRGEKIDSMPTPPINDPNYVNPSNSRGTTLLKNDDIATPFKIYNCKAQITTLFKDSAGVFLDDFYTRYKDARRLGKNYVFCFANAQQVEAFIQVSAIFRNKSLEVIQRHELLELVPDKLGYHFIPKKGYEDVFEELQMLIDGGTLSLDHGFTKLAPN